MINDLKFLIQKLVEEENFLLGGPEHNMNFAPILLHGVYVALDEESDTQNFSLVQNLKKGLKQIEKSLASSMQSTASGSVPMEVEEVKV